MPLNEDSLPSVLVSQEVAISDGDRRVYMRNSYDKCGICWVSHNGDVPPSPIFELVGVASGL